MQMEDFNLKKTLGCGHVRKLRPLDWTSRDLDILSILPNSYYNNFLTSLNGVVGALLNNLDISMQYSSGINISRVAITYPNLI